MQVSNIPIGAQPNQPAIIGRSSGGQIANIPGIKTPGHIANIPGIKTGGQITNIPGIKAGGQIANIPGLKIGGNQPPPINYKKPTIIGALAASGRKKKFW
jgi:hypothetical protein